VGFFGSPPLNSSKGGDIQIIHLGRDFVLRTLATVGKIIPVVVRGGRRACRWGGGENLAHFPLHIGSPDRHRGRGGLLRGSSPKRPSKKAYETRALSFFCVVEMVPNESSTGNRGKDFRRLPNLRPTFILF